jgi:TonB family protein
MNRRFATMGAMCATLVAACSAPEPSPQAPAPELALAAPHALPARPAPHPVAPASIDAYKRVFAQHVAHASPAVFHDPLPPMFKSIIVLDVTIDHTGRLAHVAVHRSNGYKDLEKVALNSVRQAAPFAAPARSIQRRDGSVNFLETFMFRNDGRFVIRTLADQA